MKETKPSSVVDGNDILRTWERRSDEFAFEIEDVINAQGFDGLPRVVSPEEFEEAVKVANGGEGFIAQRTYSAPNQETLDYYRETLYSGKWYVDCGTGGAQYGQGMYCAADYTGTLTEGISAEMQHYIELNESRMMHVDFRQQISDKRSEEAQLVYEKVIEDAHLSDSEMLIFRSKFDISSLSQEEQDSVWDTMANMTKEERSQVNKTVNELFVRADEERHKIRGMSIEEYAESRNLQLYATPKAYVETLTLDPSAKIVTYKDISKMQSDEIVAIKSEVRDRIGHEAVEETVKAELLTERERNYLLWGLNISDDVEKFDIDDAMSFGKDLSKEGKERYREMRSKIEESVRNEIRKTKAETIANMDIGSYAAAKGYDAINSEGHGESGSYTVVLNRTKLIIKGE